MVRPRGWWVSVTAATAAVVMVVATAVVGLGAAPAAGVAHGEAVPDGRYGFTARLTITIPFLGLPLTTYCTGALVAPAWVLTAAHCFPGAAGGPVPYRTTVFVGPATVLAPDAHRHLVAATEVHPHPDVDLALVRLARPVGDVAPVALAEAPPDAGAVLRLTGWGATQGLLPLPAARMHTGLVTVTAVDDTTVLVRGHAPAHHTSACVYDSGAPYVAEGPEGPRLVAVESDGPPCPHDRNETTVRVDTAAAWITGRAG